MAPPPVGTPSGVGIAPMRAMGQSRVSMSRFHRHLEDLHGCKSALRATGIPASFKCGKDRCGHTFGTLGEVVPQTCAQTVEIRAELTTPPGLNLTRIAIYGGDQIVASGEWRPTHWQPLAAYGHRILHSCRKAVKAHRVSR